MYICYFASGQINSYWHLDLVRQAHQPSLGVRWDLVWDGGRECGEAEFPSPHPLKPKAPVAEGSRGHLVIFNYWQDSVYP